MYAYSLCFPVYMFVSLGSRDCDSLIVEFSERSTQLHKVQGTEDLSA